MSLLNYWLELQLALRGRQGYMNSELPLTATKVIILLVIKPIKKQTAVFQRTAHKETLGKGYSLQPTISFSIRRYCG